MKQFLNTIKKYSTGLILALMLISLSLFALEVKAQVSAVSVENFFVGTTNLIDRVGSLAIDTTLSIPSLFSDSSSKCINHLNLADQDAATGSETCLSVSGESVFSALEVQNKAHFLSGSKLVIGDYTNGASGTLASDIFVIDNTLGTNNSLLVDGLKRLDLGFFTPRDTTTKTNVCALSNGTLILCGSTPTNGVCDNTTNNACSSGTLSDTADSSTNYLWSCDGLNGGTNDSCSLAIPVVENGLCGSAKYDVLTTAPSTNLCSAGTASAVTTTTTSYTKYDWTCDSTSGGTNDSCYAYKGYTYTCQSDTSWLKGSACTPRDYSSTATYTEGDNVCYFLTPSASCVPAATPVNGVCDNTTNNACSSGTLSDTADSSTNYLWSCDGLNGGTNDSCSLAIPINGVCDNTTRNTCQTPGPANDAAVADTSTDYKWACEGSSGGTTDNTCSFAKIIPVCDNTTNNACSSGTLSDTTDSSTNYLWNCVGDEGAIDSCSLAKPINGVCDNTAQNACTSGTANDAAVADTSTDYKWACDGLNGGTTDNTCSLPIPIKTADAVCSTQLNTCTVGTFSDSPDLSTYYAWNCIGINGGYDDYCLASKASCDPILECCQSDGSGGYIPGPPCA